MKILLIISDYDGGFPFIQELEEQLIAAGIDVDVLEFSRFMYKKDGVEHQYASPFFARLSKFRKLGTLVTVLAVKNQLRKISKQYDAVNIHSCEHIYYHLIKSIRRLSDNLSVMVWGSDFYRVSDRIRQKNKRIFDLVKYIVFGNPQNAKDFTDYYKAYADKCIIAGFGAKKFKLIKTLMSQDLEKTRSLFDLPAGKIIVSCGYNGRPMQQHLLLIEQISSLPAAYKDRIFLLFQLGYGADAAYARKISEKLLHAGVGYKIFDHMLTDIEVAILRVVPDITLNAQETDGFSSSIQEHLLAKNILIVGEWLPYSFLEKRGVFFKRVALNGFSEALADAVDNLACYKNKTDNNSSIMESIAGWPRRVEEWKKVYTGDVADISFKDYQ